MSINHLEKYSQMNFESMNNTIHQFLRDNIRESIYKKDIEATKAMVETIKSNNIKNIYIFSEKMTLLAQQNDIRLEIDDIPSFIKNNNDELVKYKNTSYYITRFSFLEIPMAYMIMSIDEKELLKIIEEKKNTLLTESLIFFLVSLFFIYIVALLITRPIEKIVQKLKDTSPSSTLSLGISSHDEFKFLTSSIEMNHNKLKDLNVELAKEVDKKTLELKELNKQLADKVVQEIAKNKDKDKLMIHQSRLAQMGEMISMIAHQWRQPLSAISAASTKLLVKTTLKKYDDELYKKKLENIIEYTQHLSTTIDDFRDFFKSAKEEKELGVKELISGIKNIVSASLENRNISLLVVYNYDGIISTYPNEIKQVILNLIKNAEDIFIVDKPDNPKITISVKKLEDAIQIDVEDNAGGIPTKILDKIFEPYFTTKENGDGTGLGLYMSQTIIQQHCKGVLSVKNNIEGAVFSIVLPQPKHIVMNF